MAEAITAKVQQLEAEVRLHAERAATLHRVAEDTHVAFTELGLPIPSPRGEGLGPLLEFFTEVAGKLHQLPKMVDDKLREAAEQSANSVGSVILPQVALLALGFPFDCLLHSYEEGDDKEGATRAAASAIQKLKDHLQRL